MSDSERRKRDFAAGYLMGLAGMPLAITPAVEVPDSPDSPTSPVEPPVMAPRRTWSDYYWGRATGITFDTIRFVNTYTPTGDEELVWAADKDGTGSIMCYGKGDTLYIAGNGSGKIIANEDCGAMFEGFHASTITGLKLLDTSNVTNMHAMFMNCASLVTLDLSSFDTSNVTDMAAMFLHCHSLRNPILTSFDTSNVTDMYAMFCACYALVNLDLRSFNTRKVVDMEQMFHGSEKMEEITVGPDWVLDKTDTFWMFEGCGVQSVTYSSEPVAPPEPDAPYISLGNPNENAVAYLYGPDQVRLPAWPAWDELMYPYACIVVKGEDYYFYCKEKPPSVKADGGLSSSGYNEYTKKLVDGVWEKSTGVLFASNTVIWANYGVYYTESAGGTLYMEASKPEAVYEPGNEPGIIVSIDNRAIMLGCRLGYIIRSQMGNGQVEIPEGVLLSSDGYILTDCDGFYLIAMDEDADAVPEGALIASGGYILKDSMGRYLCVKNLPVSYLYNGVELPPLPEWDTESYPYAAIYTDADRTVFKFYCDAAGEIVNSGGTCLLMSTSRTMKAENGAWVKSVGGLAYTPIWANHDVFYNTSAGELSGKLFLAASEPVPIY